MKQQKLSDYKPNYPKKAMRRAALAAAALLALGATTGCKTQNIEPELSGAVALDDEPGIEEFCPQEPMTTGMIGIAPTPEAEEPPSIQGITIPEGTAAEEPELMGDVAVIDDLP